MVVLRIRGVPVSVGWSWFIILLLVFWSLADSFFPSTYPGLTLVAYLLMAAVATLLFFVSLLLHELSHTFRSQREGVRVRAITLWLLGGVSEMEEPLPTPAAEFRVVIAGPLASGALAAVFFGIAVGGRALGLPEELLGVPAYLAWINALLMAFNLVPALPLDGGRLLHALLWWRSGDRSTATIRAAVAGWVFAGLLAVAGVVSLVRADVVNGIWFLVLGWFVFAAGRREAAGARADRTLTRLRVRDVMAADPPTVTPAATIEDIARMAERRPDTSAYPVLDDGSLVGLLLLQYAGAVPIEQRARVRVADVMLRPGQLPTLHPDDPLAVAVSAVSRPPGHAVVVRDGTSELIGVLSAADLSRPVRGSSGP
jgi:Zn-dependent protease/predicted transcriptional regulator